MKTLLFMNFHFLPSKNELPKTLTGYGARFWTTRNRGRISGRRGAIGKLGSTPAAISPAHCEMNQALRSKPIQPQLLPETDKPASSHLTVAGIGVGGASIRAGDLEIQNRLPKRLVFGMEEGESLGLVSGFQTRLLFCHGVLGAELPVASPIQNESLFQTLPFLAGNVN
jgi:hypothetical protein